MLRPPIFVINHPEAAARRQQISRALNDARLPHTIVPAMDGPEETGRVLSHVAVLERVVRDQVAHACVLEDAVTIADDLPEILDVLMAGAGDWEVVLLGHHSARRTPAQGAETTNRQLPLNDRRTIGRVAEFAIGAHAYMVTTDAARRLLARARPFRMPMDRVVGHAPADGLRLFAVTPPCVALEGVEEPRAIGGSILDRLALAVRKAGLWTDSYAKKA